MYPACLLTTHPLVSRRIILCFLVVVLSVFDFDYVDGLPSLSAYAILRRSKHSATVLGILSMEDLCSRLKNQENGKALFPYQLRILDNDLHEGCSVRVTNLGFCKRKKSLGFQKSNRPTPVFVLKSRGTSGLFFYYSTLP